MTRSVLAASYLALLGIAASPALAAEMTVLVQPERVELVGPGAYQQLLVTVVRDGKAQEIEVHVPRLLRTADL